MATENDRQDDDRGSDNPWESQMRPLKGFAIGSIYVGLPVPKNKRKKGKKWAPPKVSMTAPKMCRDEGFSPDTCFNCIRETCIFDDQPERINKKRKVTKNQIREAEKIEKEKEKLQEEAGDRGLSP